MCVYNRQIGIGLLAAGGAKKLSGPHWTQVSLSQNFANLIYYGGSKRVRNTTRHD